MKSRSSGRRGKIIAGIVLVICFLVQLGIIVRFHDKQSSVRLNFIEEEVVRRANILGERIVLDLEFLKLEILEKSKYKTFSEQDYMKGKQFVSYLKSLQYLRSISIATKNEVEELIRLNNNNFLKKELSKHNSTLQFTPINVDENAIIVFDGDSITDSTLVSTRWLLETLESGQPYYCSYLKEDSLTDLHYFSVSHLVSLSGNHYLGLKVDVSLEGVYSFFGPTVKESSVLMVDEIGHVCCFCNDSGNCTPHQRCSFCERLEQEYRNKEGIKIARKYFFLSGGNINCWKVITMDSWGKKNYFVIASHRPIKNVLSDFLLGILLLVLVVVAVFLIVHNWTRKEEKTGCNMFICNPDSTGVQLKKANYEAITEKQREKFINDFKTLIDDERHFEPAFNVGTFAVEFDYPRDMINSLSMSVSGQSFCARLNQERVRSAIAKITATDKKQLHIDEIFETVGFRSKASFYREFKQYTGKTPKE